MHASKIKVMIVDDSIFFREFMSRALSQDLSIEVVGLASDAFEAMQMMEKLMPDVIALDMEMPKMRGTDFLKTVKPRFPDIRVVVISSNADNVFEALQAGAVEFVSKPNAQAHVDNASFIREAISKIKIAAASTLTRRVPMPPAQKADNPQAPAPRPVVTPGAPLVLPESGKAANPRTVIAIGASTGGTEAILAVLKDLPANTPGIVVVQHMPPVFTKMYAERLDRICKMEVREAVNGDRVERGLVLIAAGDKHMRLRSDARGYYVSCEAGERVSGHCPSVDALFESVAQHAKANAVGIILTGMGSDGAKNMLAMKRAGAYTFGQDQATCVVYGMPMVAYNLGGVVEQLPLQSIAPALVRYLSK